MFIFSVKNKRKLGVVVNQFTVNEYENQTAIFFVYPAFFKWLITAKLSAMMREVLWVPMCLFFTNAFQVFVKRLVISRIERDFFNIKVIKTKNSN